MTQVILAAIIRKNPTITVAGTLKVLRVFIFCLIDMRVAGEETAYIRRAQPLSAVDAGNQSMHIECV